MSYFILFIAALSSLVGLLFLRFRPSDAAMHIFVGVGAGIMTSISLTDILPESAEMLETAGIWFFVGFCAVFLLDYFHCTHPHVGHSAHHDLGESWSIHSIDHDHHSTHGAHVHGSEERIFSHSSAVQISSNHHHSHKKRWLSGFSGLFIHTFFDGVAIITAFSIDSAIGILVAVGVILHQIPVSLGLFSILESSQFSVAKIRMFYAIFAASLLIGGFTASLSLLEFMESYLLAFAGGTLLYVGASDLLPDLKSHSRFAFRSVLSFFLGGAIPVIASLLLVSHPH